MRRVRLSFSERSKGTKVTHAGLVLSLLLLTKEHHTSKNRKLVTDTPEQQSHCLELLAGGTVSACPWASSLQGKGQPRAVLSTPLTTLGEHSSSFLLLSQPISLRLLEGEERRRASLLLGTSDASVWVRFQSHT